MERQLSWLKLISLFKKIVEDKLEKKSTFQITIKKNYVMGVIKFQSIW